MRATPDAIWIVGVARVYLLGLLWTDWLWQHFRDEYAGPRFERAIVKPLMVTAIVGASVACYQGFVDLHFLWTGRWPLLGRAAGTLLDANASGALCALWVALPIAFAVTSGRRGWGAVLLLSSALLAMAVWTTASRTGLLVAVVALAGRASCGGARWH